MTHMASVLTDTRFLILEPNRTGSSGMSAANHSCSDSSILMKTKLFKPLILLTASSALALSVTSCNRDREVREDVDTTDSTRGSDTTKGTGTGGTTSGGTGAGSAGSGTGTTGSADTGTGSGSTTGGTGTAGGTGTTPPKPDEEEQNR
jgi:hypothetical protein